MENKDWKFSKISSSFQEHVQKQLPWYNLVSESLCYIVESHCSENTLIYDIGCSKKNIYNILESKIKERNIKYVGIDNESSMNPDIVCNAEDYPYQEFDVAILNLTLMFLSVEKRSKLISTLKDKMKKGGIIIIVDKFLTNESYLSVVYRRLTFLWKIKSGFSAQEILDKEMSLNGVQIPLQHSELSIYKPCLFFKLGEFEGWVIK